MVLQPAAVPLQLALHPRRRDVLHHQPRRLHRRVAVTNANQRERIAVRKHGRNGHLFRNHYSWQPVENDEHLLEAVRYILLNPVRAGICEKPENWRWSSYRAIADLDLPPEFLALTDVLSIFGTTPTTARAAFLDMFK